MRYLLLTLVPLALWLAVRHSPHATEPAPTPDTLGMVRALASTSATEQAPIQWEPSVGEIDDEQGRGYIIVDRQTAPATVERAQNVAWVSTPAWTLRLPMAQLTYGECFRRPFGRSETLGVWFGPDETWQRMLTVSFPAGRSGELATMCHANHFPLDGNW